MASNERSRSGDVLAVILWFATTIVSWANVLVAIAISQPIVMQAVMVAINFTVLAVYTSQLKGRFKP